MAWLTITEKQNWEYSDTPNTDKKLIDSYDYDRFTNHINGIITDPHGIRYALARQIYPSEAGYGELYFSYIGAGYDPLEINNITLSVNDLTVYVN